MTVAPSEMPSERGPTTSVHVPSHGDSTDTGAHPKEDEGAAASCLEKANSKVIPPNEESGDDPFRHLPEDEATILKRQIITPEVKAGVAALYRYSSTNDMIVVVVSTICAIASGAAMPLMTIIFGNLQHAFQDSFFMGSLDYDDFKHQMAELVLYFVYLAIG